MTITFDRDGHYALSTLNTYVNTIADTFAASSAGSEGGGCYAIAGQHMDVTDSAGETRRIFLFRDAEAGSDTVQLGTRGLTQTERPLTSPQRVASAQERA